MIDDVKILLAVKAKQKIDYINICRKSRIDEHKNIKTLTKQLYDYYDKLFDEILKLYLRHDTVYMYQVEEIIFNRQDEYEAILLNNIHDYYLEVSETSEQKIENLHRQQTTETITQQRINNAEKGAILDKLIDIKDYINNINIDEIIPEQLTNNIQRLKKIKLPYTQMTETINDLFTFEVDEAVTEYMANEVFTASAGTMQRITQEVYTIIKESYADEGNGITNVTNDIINKFTELKKYEAERIARTETLKAQGNANYKRLLNNDTVEYKQWLATDDERTRDSHSEQNEQITFVDGTFENGCQYPGDTGADIEEWINCRCDLVAYYPEPGMVAPAGVDYWFEEDMVLDLDVERFDYLVEVPEFISSYW